MDGALEAAVCCALAGHRFDPLGRRLYGPTMTGYRPTAHVDDASVDKSRIAHVRSSPICLLQAQRPTRA